MTEASPSFPQGWESFQTERGIGIRKVVRGKLCMNAVLGHGQEARQALRVWAEVVDR